MGFLFRDFLGFCFSLPLLDGGEVFMVFACCGVGFLRGLCKVWGFVLNMGEMLGEWVLKYCFLENQPN